MMFYPQLKYGLCDDNSDPLNFNLKF